jgi:CRISPR/Cas system-associated exonuclease Cas4 (RecB family)
VAAEWQVGAYALAYEEMHGVTIKHGRIVEIRADGYKVVPVKNLARRKNEWLAILTAYRCRREAGKTEVANG